MGNNNSNNNNKFIYVSDIIRPLCTSIIQQQIKYCNQQYCSEIYSYVLTSSNATKYHLYCSLGNFILKCCMVLVDPFHCNILHEYTTYIGECIYKWFWNTFRFPNSRLGYTSLIPAIYYEILSIARSLSVYHVCVGMYV